MTAQEHSQPFPVPVAEYVGRNKSFNPDGSPCCAEGHAIAASSGRATFYEGVYRKRRTTYTALAVAHLGVRMSSVPDINDSIECAETRRLLYHTTWCLLGFTDGMPEDALALAEQVKADNPGVFNKEI